MRVLVTGAAGFIGFHVTQALLARGDAVLGVDNLNAYYQVSLKRDRLDAIEQLRGPFEFLEVDFADDARFDAAIADQEVDAIVHLGAQAGVRYSIENPRAYIHSNLAGHLNVLELARRRGTRHLVYASSSSVYAGLDRMPFRVEDRVDHPVSLYAATKRSDELLSETYSHLYRIPQTGLRFFTVYGPWGRPDMAAWIFTAKILAAEPIPVFNHGKMKRDFTYIDDIVAGVLAVLDHPPLDDGRVKRGGSKAPHQIYNIGNAQPEELDTLIRTIEHACGRDAVRDYQPMQPGDVLATYADVSAIEADLGYVPKVGIDQGIPNFVDWYRSYHQV